MTLRQDGGDGLHKQNPLGTPRTTSHHLCNEARLATCRLFALASGEFVVFLPGNYTLARHHLRNNGDMATPTSEEESGKNRGEQITVARFVFPKS